MLERTGRIRRLAAILRKVMLAMRARLSFSALRWTLVLAMGLGVSAGISFAHNFPNPFNPSTEILFDLPETAMVSLAVYDVSGREVARLIEGELPAGWHRARFDAGSLSSGVYLYRIRAGDFRDTGRMILLK